MRISDWSSDVCSSDLKAPVADYDGYGSCPLTVERGKIVLAEFGYGGKPLPSFPNWLIAGTKPSRLSWLLKDTILPPIYWPGKIGRASCRERVCQYVSISVVAV